MIENTFPYKTALLKVDVKINRIRDTKRTYRFSLIIFPAKCEKISLEMSVDMRIKYFVTFFREKNISSK